MKGLTGIRRYTIRNYDSSYDAALSSALDFASYNSLRHYRGYKKRGNVFSRYNSCWCEKDEDTIKELNNKIENNPYAFSILLSTCCEYLESVGYNNPLDWTVEQFRYTEVAISIIVSELILNKKIKIIDV